MTYFGYTSLAIALMIVSIVFWGKETDVYGWHYHYTDHRNRFLSVPCAVAGLIILYLLYGIGISCAAIAILIIACLIQQA